MEIYADARPFYRGLYKCHPDLARSINIKSFYDMVIYGSMDSMELYRFP